MKNITIWHNPSCSKSRQALKILIQAEDDQKIKLTTRLYLKEIPSIDELDQVFHWLNLDTPKEWIRKSEAIYKDLNIEEINEINTLLKLMNKNPILIERAVVIDEDCKIAIIARPVEKVLDLIS